MNQFYIRLTRIDFYFLFVNLPPTHCHCFEPFAQNQPTRSDPAANIHMTQTAFHHAFRQHISVFVLLVYMLKRVTQEALLPCPWVLLCYCPARSRTGLFHNNDKTSRPSLYCFFKWGNPAVQGSGEVFFLLSFCLVPLFYHTHTQWGKYRQRTTVNKPWLHLEVQSLSACNQIKWYVVGSYKGKMLQQDNR